MLTKGFYIADNSDLLIEVFYIPYQNSEYSKVKLNIFNKYNGIAYESRKNYKLIHSKIDHWKKVDPYKSLRT